MTSISKDKLAEWMKKHKIHPSVVYKNWTLALKMCHVFLRKHIKALYHIDTEYTAPISM